MDRVKEYLTSAKAYLQDHPKVTAVLVALLIGVVVGAYLAR